MYYRHAAVAQAAAASQQALQRPVPCKILSPMTSNSLDQFSSASTTPTTPNGSMLTTLAQSSSPGMTLASFGASHLLNTHPSSFSRGFSIETPPPSSILTNQRVSTEIESTIKRSYSPPPSPQRCHSPLSLKVNENDVIKNGYRDIDVIGNGDRDNDPKSNFELEPASRN